jgi:hypothetical protein
MNPMDLVEFLRARLDRDERVARACAGASWTASPSGRIQVESEKGTNGQTPEDCFVAAAENGAYAEHIARHDPARALREVAAKRQILDDYEKDAWAMSRGRSDQTLEAVQAARLTVLRLLAQTYRGHPSYRDEWRP